MPLTVAAKPIETRAFGCRFRSRLEARWATVFDHIGIEWHYEHEGFETEQGWYLPDFWLPGLNTFVEVKPDFHCSQKPGSSWRRLDALCMSNHAFGAVCADLKGAPSRHLRSSGIVSSFDSIMYWGDWKLVTDWNCTGFFIYDKPLVNQHLELLCPVCGCEVNGLVGCNSQDEADARIMKQMTATLQCGRCKTEWTVNFHERYEHVAAGVMVHKHGLGPLAHVITNDAITAGLSARFEHGESP